MQIAIPVTVYWKRVLPNLWINVAGSSRGSARVDQPSRKLGRTRIPLRSNITTLIESNFFDSSRTAVRVLQQLRTMGFIPNFSDQGISEF